MKTRSMSDLQSLISEDEKKKLAEENDKRERQMQETKERIEFMDKMKNEILKGQKK